MAQDVFRSSNIVSNFSAEGLPQVVANQSVTVVLETLTIISPDRVYVSARAKLRVCARTIASPKIVLSPIATTMICASFLVEFKNDQT